ncbi:MAG: kelch repeat-containing protein, partial [Actinobacteria bacterium]|nr:kelch repeat-containing protein [Actinomycetota bacterium]
FTGTSYTLALEEDLANNYYVMVAGGDDSGGNSGPDHSQIRVDGDPFGNLVATTSANELRLDRGDAPADWVGSVTVVECVSSCATEGFQLSEVLDVSLANGNLSSDTTLASAHTANTVPFGGYLGGGLSTTEASNNNFSATAGVRVRKNSTNQIRIERNNTQGTAAAADVTVYVVEWGSSWNVQEANIDDWNTGGQGVDDVSEYATAAISSVNRDNTWVWKSPGTSEDNGLGDGSFGKVVTLGDGVNQNATETTVAIGAEPAAGGDIRDDTIYVLEHPDLNTDYRFVPRSNYGTSFTDSVDAAIVSETVSTNGNVTSSAGNRIPLFYYTDNGIGTAYTRVAGWSHYHSNDTTISFAKSFSGNNQSGWIQSVDFGDMAGSSGGRDITSWSTATNGLPSARSQFGAAVWNDRIYVIGGLDDSSNPTDTVYISPK